MMMSPKWSNILLSFSAPLLTLGLLAGMVREHRTYLSEADFEPYHQRAAAAIDEFSRTRRSIGSWAGSQEEVIKEAQQLLKPNRILSLRYTDARSNYLLDPSRRVSLLIVQCKVSGDMVGHYPRNCYRSIGNEMVQATPRDWKIDDLTIPLTEYHFRRTENRRTYWTIVYNFMIVPGRGIVRDMEGVKAAAEDYQQRYYGAAQFQLVFHAPLEQSERDEIFTLFLRELMPTIRILQDTQMPIGAQP